MFGLPAMASSAMSGISDPVSAGLSSYAGNLMSNDMNRYAADHAMDRSDDMAREQMGFQERMSNTAYQRATEDMKKAGINPMVAFQQGGASTPAGAGGTSGMMPKLDSGIGGALSSALDVVKLKKDLDGNDAQIALNRASATNALAQAGAAGSSAKLTDANAKAVNSQLKSIAARAEADTIKSGYDAKAAGYDAIMSRANRDSGTAKNLLNLFGIKGGPDLRPNEMKIDKNTGQILQEGQP